MSALEDLKALQSRYEQAAQNARAQQRDPKDVGVSLVSVAELIDVLVKLAEEQYGHIPHLIAGLGPQVMEKKWSVAPDGGNY